MAGDRVISTYPAARDTWLLVNSGTNYDEDDNANYTQLMAKAVLLWAQVEAGNGRVYAVPVTDPRSSIDIIRDCLGDEHDWTVVVHEVFHEYLMSQLQLPCKCRRRVKELREGVEWIASVTHDDGCGVYVDYGNPREAS